MKNLCVLVCSGALLFAADPAITIYNQNFAVIREILPLDLKAGSNALSFNGVTAQVEPDSVILRDPAGARPLQVLEQNYRNDPSRRSGYSICTRARRLGSSQANYDNQQHRQRKDRAQRCAAQPADVPTDYRSGRKAQFSLPGQLIFPVLGDDTILKSALDWLLYSALPARFDAELSYVSGGLSWTSDYNIIAPDTGDKDVVGWVTLSDNQSGKQFDHAHIKLMAVT